MCRLTRNEYKVSLANLPSFETDMTVLKRKYALPYISTKMASR